MHRRTTAATAADRRCSAAAAAAFGECVMRANESGKEEGGRGVRKRGAPHCLFDEEAFERRLPLAKSAFAKERKEERKGREGEPPPSILIHFQGAIA